MENSAPNSEVDVQQPVEPRKRKITGRMSEVRKKLKLSTHEAGDPCNCKRYKCFEVTDDKQRREILHHFNSLGSHNEQNSYLAGLITLLPVKRRRPRKTENLALLHDASFAYRISVCIDGDLSRKIDISVCAKAFCAIHGITMNKLSYITNSLKCTGSAPEDKRGRHSTFHRKLDESTKFLICQHIKSFRGHESHYNIKDSRRIYLPEDLCVKKMFRLFKELHPTTVVSYETYRCIFNSNFNISFGYPRSDICATCDEFQAKVKALSPEKDGEEIQKLTTLNVQHKKTAEMFYDQKENAKNAALKSKNVEAICMDFVKNISLPNISIDDVYYKRRLSMYAFNIHVLSTGLSVFYIYHEGIANKGANEVASFLFHFINNYLDDDVEELKIFCDSAGEQNKNYTIFRFIHYVTTCNIHGVKEIKLTFPVHGHSYMECDKNASLWNLKTKMETPNDFCELVKNSRVEPSPFIVVSVTQEIVLDWKTFLDKRYYVKCHFKIQPVKEVVASSIHSRLLQHRPTYNGPQFSSAIRKSNTTSEELKPGNLEMPLQAYRGQLPISEAKYKDIMSLTKFCGPTATNFFMCLAYE